MKFLILDKGGELTELASSLSQNQPWRNFTSEEEKGTKN